MVAAVFRTIFAQPDPEAVSTARDEVRDQLAGSFPKVGSIMDQAKTEVLAFTGFPNAAAVIRLVGAVLIDMHDEWIASDRRYLSEASMALLSTSMDTGEHAAIESGD